MIARYLTARQQVIVHLGLLVVCMLLLPIAPSEAFKPDSTGSPFLDIITLLTITVGAPYALISATGPLLQSWYALRYEGSSPYRLYALSNLGSMLGLVSYPFLFEPIFKLDTQTWLWSSGFVLYIGLCGWAGYNLFRYLKGTNCSRS